MASGTPTNRTNINLPVDISKDIIAKAVESSAVMALGRKVTLPGRGKEIPVILGDPEASWVSETGKKPVSNPNLSQKILRPYKLAVIVPFSNEFKRDLTELYDEIVRRLPAALGKKFDETVFGFTDAPGSDFDNFASVTGQEIGTDTYDGLVAADTDISVHGGIVNGYALSPQGKGVLLAAKDKNDRPIFINSVAEGAIPMVLGSKTHLSRGAYNQGTNVVGFAGDWTMAMWGAVNEIELKISDQATLDLGDGNVIYLWQQNMFAVLAEIEVGFRADTSVFNKLTATPEVSG